MKAFARNKNWLVRLGLVFCLGLVQGCAFSVAPSDDEDRLVAVELSAFPDRISAEDSLVTAEIWATVRRGGRPVADSTVVFFATTVGQITPSSITLDGLAIAVLTGPGDGRPRRGEIIAQALTVRDTIDFDVVLSGLD